MSICILVGSEKKKSFIWFVYEIYEKNNRIVAKFCAQKSVGKKFYE